MSNAYVQVILRPYKREMSLDICNGTVTFIHRSNVKVLKKLWFHKVKAMRVFKVVYDKYVNTHDHICADCTILLVVYFFHMKFDKR